MRQRTLAVIALFVLGTFAGAQQGPPPGGGAGQGRGGRQGGPGGGPAPVPSVSKRPSGAELGTIRVAAQDENIWFGWRVAIPTSAFRGMTFSEAAARADVMSLASVEVSSAQRVAVEVPKPFDHRLQAGERNAVNYRLRELRLQVSTYRVENLPADEAARRMMFEFAKGLVGTPTIIVPAAAASSVVDLDKLAGEYDVNVAVDSKTNPKPLIAALGGRSRRIGVAADLDGWLQSGVAPVEGLKTTGDKLMAVRTRGGHDGAMSAFFLAAYQAGIKPLSITIESAGVTEADMSKNLDAFERVMLPAMAERVRVMLASPAGQIRGGDRLPADMRARIDAAAPRTAAVTPKQPRKMLVTDIQMYTGHSTVPHGNYLLELMGKYTGAFEPTFSNDLELLRYPKIKEFDAVFLSNVCGMVHNDPQVRADLLRYVREGGGIGGTHAVTFTNNNWPEFAEMMGGWAGAHRVEKQILKVDDPDSPLMKSFGSSSFEHTDEFYQFPMYSPYSRQKQHVLLSIDVEQSDRATGGRFCELCTRTDQDYGFAWIRQYGKGRTYFTALGHTDIMYTDPRFTNHLLAAIQYVLGDLDADATPSAKLPRK
jgi:type 1 glutamine amidotransferase